MLQVYNTLTRAKEDFYPLNPPQVRMYVCGVTVYDLCHIGHARSVVAFDAVVRYLEHSGYRVTLVRNFTDVDDKIINRAIQEGVSAQEIAERYIAAFRQDLAPLGLRPADVEPKATEHIGDIVAAVAGLVEKGQAYAVDGDVYFSVPDFPKYGELSGRNLEELKSGARVEVDERKRSPLDFALWKASKPGEPAWESPWGPGRPGWHIECSAMSTRYLGESFDIHGGGEDLIFPHHENEKAQSEALTGKPFAKYWLHNGFVRINSEKMSKSLGNFLTVRDILRQYHPEVLRLFLLSAHYRSPLDYTLEAMAEADEGATRLFEAWQRAEETLAAESPAEAGDLAREAQAAETGFREAMDSDFNTAQALGFLFTLARAVNRAADVKGKKRPAALAGLAQAEETLVKLCRVLGLLGRSPAEFEMERRDLILERKGLRAEEIETLVQARTEARKAKDFTQADRLRDQLAEMGAILFDSAQGTTWKLKV